MSDEIQVGDVFEPTGGPSSQAVEVRGLKPGGFVSLQKIDNGVTFDACADMILDPLKWVRAGYMGSRDPLPALDAQPALTIGMARKVGKWRPSLVPSGTMEAVARAMQAGIDAGHVEGDWKTREASVFVDAAIRHLVAHADGKRDEDHLAHALASVAIARNLSA